MRLGLDFGTTNSAAAIYDGRDLHPISVDPDNDNPAMLPSLIYIDRQGDALVGTRAASTYLQNETGRRVAWRRREAGEIPTTVAGWENEPIEFWQKVNAYVDEAANGRLLQSIKTALFNRHYEGTRIFDRYYKLESLIAIILRTLKHAAERDLNRRCEKVLLGRPVRFSTNPLADSRAESILLKAAHLAGFKDIIFRLEPIGVVHLLHRQSTDRQTALVFDFGGGTLDLTVARIGGSQPPEILATAGVLVGGDDLDRRLMHTLLPHFGGGDDGILPPQMSDKLLAWQTMPELSRPQEIESIRILKKRHPSQREKLEALEALVTENLGFALFKEIESLKRQLSEHANAVLHFKYDGVEIHETITRRRFNRLISAEMEQVTQGIKEVLARAHLPTSAIDVVLRTGGSSLVPAFQQRLVDMFGADKLHAIDPLASVVGGFAVAAHTVQRQWIQPEAVILNIQAESGRAYHPAQMAVGVRCYTDWNFTVDRIPSALDGLPMIQTANHDREGDSRLHFRLAQPARVYVAYDAAVRQQPRWLREFTPENMHIELEDDFAQITRTLRVYGRDYPAGDVKLGTTESPAPPAVQYMVIIDTQPALSPVEVMGHDSGRNKE